MKKNIFLLLLMALVLSGCYKDNKQKVIKPPDLIPENKLANIIKDMDFVQGIVSYERTHGNRRPAAAEKKYYDYLFKHYGVTAEQVRQSISYYIALGKPMVNIYDKVLEQFYIDQTLLYERQHIVNSPYLDSTGVLRLMWTRHWINNLDSTAPYCFKPIF